MWLKARERELAASDENRLARGMRNLMLDENEGKTPVTITACLEGRWE